jgi:HSP20 family molecular chaperone IbpA
MDRTITCDGSRGKPARRRALPASQRLDRGMHDALQSDRGSVPVAQKIRGLTLTDFARTFDEFFDELLIDPWQCGEERDEFERSEIFDHGDRYEVRVAVRGVDRSKIDAEVTAHRLTVRAPGGIRGTLESSFSFVQEIETSAATATTTAIKDTLVINLPKRKSRRIALKES